MFDFWVTLLLYLLPEVNVMAKLNKLKWVQRRIFLEIACPIVIIKTCASMCSRLWCTNTLQSRSIYCAVSLVWLQNRQASKSNFPNSWDCMLILTVNVTGLNFNFWRSRSFFVFWSKYAVNLDDSPRVCNWISDMPK